MYTYVLPTRMTDLLHPHLPPLTPVKHAFKLHEYLLVDCCFSMDE